MRRASTLVRLITPLVALVAMALGSSGCSGAPAILDCRDDRGIHPICGFHNPEDLSLLEDGHRLVVSQLASMTDPTAAGSLVVLDLEDEQIQLAYPLPTSDATASPAAGWGDPQCPGPPSPFNPHGIDMARRGDGRLQLLAVNHGERESIEFFEVLPEQNNVLIIWRGCAIPPAGAFFNDVVNLPGGGLLATHMMERDGMAWAMLRAFFGADTGFVYEWQPARGYAPVVGTEGPFPNGIEISADGAEIFLNVYMAGEVRRISRATGEVLAVAEVESPDNLSWAKDGRLLVASHLGGLSEQLPCMNLKSGACPMSFEIHALDPVSLKGGAIFANRGAPMGGGTVAIDVGGELVIGSFAGDRVIRAPISQP